jgi:hypothetical protein
MTQLDKKTLSHLLKEVSVSSIKQDKSIWWTNEAEMEDITTHTNVNVSQSYKSSWSQLIFKHSYIVSNDKSELERVQNFLTKFF